jgi:Ser/Thr protein kinase RdoA (MazF antagonist)
MQHAALAGSMVGSRPALPPHRLRALLRDRWGIEGELAPLPSERDQNTRIDVHGRPTYVLKVLNPAEDPAFLDAQDAVAARLVDAGLPVVRPLAPLDGREPVLEPTPHGLARVRVATWLDGRPLATLDHAARPPGLAREIGVLLGRVTLALDGLQHPGADRPFQWDLLRAVETVERACRTSPIRRAARSSPGASTDSA